MQGVITAIRKMVTLREAHLPRVLMNCILSPGSLSAAAVVNQPARLLTPRAESAMAGKTNISLWFPSNLFPKERKKILRR